MELWRTGPPSLIELRRTGPPCLQSDGGRDAPPILRTTPPAAAVRRKRVEPLCNLAREIGDISHRHDDDMVGAFAHHQVDGFAPLEQTEIGAIPALGLVFPL